MKRRGPYAHYRSVHAHAADWLTLSFPSRRMNVTYHLPKTFEQCEFGT
jgi:hypothetical protein